jgi:hypothetical protein
MQPAWLDASDTTEPCRQSFIAAKGRELVPFPHLASVPIPLPTSAAVGNQEIEQELKDEAHGGSVWSLTLSRDAAVERRNCRDGALRALPCRVGDDRSANHYGNGAIDGLPSRLGGGVPSRGLVGQPGGRSGSGAQGQEVAQGSRLTMLPRPGLLSQRRHLTRLLLQRRVFMPKGRPGCGPLAVNFPAVSQLRIHMLWYVPRSRAHRGPTAVRSLESKLRQDPDRAARPDREGLIGTPRLKMRLQNRDPSFIT